MMMAWNVSCNTCGSLAAFLSIFCCKQMTLSMVSIPSLTGVDESKIQEKEIGEDIDYSKWDKK